MILPTAFRVLPLGYQTPQGDCRVIVTVDDRIGGHRFGRTIPSDVAEFLSTLDERVVWSDVNNKTQTLLAWLADENLVWILDETQQMPIDVVPVARKQITLMQYSDDGSILAAGEKILEPPTSTGMIVNLMDGIRTVQEILDHLNIEAGVTKTSAADQLRSAAFAFLSMLRGVGAITLEPSVR